MLAVMPSVPVGSCVTHTQGDFTYEPSYNFVKETPSLAVTRKLSNKDRWA